VWSEDSWYVRTDGETRAALVADLDGDGTDEIITGNETGFLVAYDYRSQRLWKKLTGTPINDLAIADVTGDGREELLIAGDAPGLTAMTAAGEMVGVWSPGGGVLRILVRDGGITLLMRDGRVLKMSGGAA
ncbi:MAG: VCBS repeat-containing protein, partial [Armatimonadetes bacterium]|nr:VCBS repeat-containing protein [Armatimonadota bacterium]